MTTTRYASSDNSLQQVAPPEAGQGTSSSRQFPTDGTLAAMQDSPAAEVESVARARPRRRWRRLLVVSAIMLFLFGVPWWTLLSAGTQWPAVVIAAAQAYWLQPSSGCR
jgi:hypothetical protein